MAIFSALTNDATGVKPFLAGILNPIFGEMSPFVLFAVVLAICLVLTNFANNGVIALMLLSIVYITTADMHIANMGYFVSIKKLQKYASSAQTQPMPISRVTACAGLINDNNYKKQVSCRYLLFCNFKQNVWKKRKK